MSEIPTNRPVTDGGDAADSESDDPDLASLVAAHPGEVARLLEAHEDTVDVVESIQETPELDETVPESGTKLVMVSDGSEEMKELGESVGANADELASGIETIAQLQRTGTLDDLAEMSELASLISGAIDDEMVMSLSSTGTRLGELADTASDEDVANGLDDTLDAMGEATSEPPESVGILGLLKSIRDPDVRMGLGVFIELARSLGQKMQR